MIQSGDKVRVTYMSELGSISQQRSSTMTSTPAVFVGLESRPDTSPLAEEGGVEIVALFDDHDGRIAVPIHHLEGLE